MQRAGRILQGYHKHHGGRTGNAFSTEAGGVSGTAEPDQSSFSYNTLEAIRADALIAGVDQIADTTEALATFFRYTITDVERLVTLSVSWKMWKIILPFRNSASVIG